MMALLSSCSACVSAVMELDFSCITNVALAPELCCVALKGNADLILNGYCLLSSEIERDRKKVRKLLGYVYVHPIFTNKWLS